MRNKFGIRFLMIQFFSLYLANIDIKEKAFILSPPPSPSSKYSYRRNYIHFKGKPSPSTLNVL